MADQKKTQKPTQSNTKTKNNTSSNKKSDSGKNQKSSKPAGNKNPKKAPQQQQIDERRDSFLRNFMPYILGAVSLFLIVCFVVNLFAGDIEKPSEHPMGVFGYYICYGLFGCLSWVAYLLPAVLITLTVFWQRYFKTGRVVSKLVLAILLLLLLSSLTHVIVCTANKDMAHVINPLKLFQSGAKFKSGGVIGGLLGFLLYWALRLPGTIVLALVTLPLIIMCLVGVTPREVFGKILRLIRASKEKRALNKADADDNGRDRNGDSDDDRDNDADDDDIDDMDDSDDSDDDVITPPVKEPEKKKRRGDKTVQSHDTVDLSDPDQPDPDASDAPSGRAKGKRLAVVDIDTGEITEPEDNGESVTIPLFESDRRETDTTNEHTTDRRVDKQTEQRADRKNHQQSVSNQEVLDDLPWDYTPPANPKPLPQTLPLAEEEPEDEDDTMEVSYDDLPPDEDEDEEELVPPTRISGRRVSYEVVEDSEDPDTRSAGQPVSVRILKSERSAVDERGLSEEEIVLPSGSGTPTEEITETREYRFPASEMLTRGPSQYATNDAEIAENTQILRDVLESFRIGVREISCSCGPTITRFEVKPDTGVRVRSIANLVDDIAMGLAKAGVRIEAPIPGKSAVGIEVPNAEPDTVYLRNILETPEFRNHKSRIAACLGADVSGRPVILDINKMPHLLIAGATGTGKSVCINSLIMSILFKARPDEVKLILIDPKKVEFAMYRDLPHLYAPVVSDPKKAAGALNSAVNEMERRFELIEEVGVRNLAGYNEITAGDPERPPLPQMVIIIDELADLMMTAPAEVETAICRLAQKARAAGIHLIIGTQRPSVDVITGLIKANVPSRIAFTVKSGVDSRTILDTVGADKLIGRGDMLYAPIGCNKPIRAQGCFVSESEVEKVVTFIKEHNDGPVYNEDFARSIDLEAAKCGAGKKKGEQMSLDDFDGIGGGQTDGEDPKFWEALEVAVTKDKIGTSALQRACNLGYGRAAKIIDRMEELGFVGPDPGTKQGRKVIISKQELIQYKLNGLPGTRGDGEDDED